MRRIVLTLLVALLALGSVQAQKTYALITGVSNYEGRSNDLNQSTKDAKNLANLYKSKGATVIVLTSKYATRDNVIAEIRNLAKTATSQDRIVFAYSGHGMPNTICTYSSHGSPMLTYNELFTELDKCKAKDIVCYIDACFSGTAAAGMHEKDYSTATEWIDVPKGNPRYMVFLSSREDEKSQESGLIGSGLMTNALIKGLRGKADYDKDKKITAIELFKYIHADIPLHNEKQHPQFISSSSLYNTILMSW